MRLRPLTTVAYEADNLGERSPGVYETTPPRRVERPLMVADSAGVLHVVAVEVDLRPIAAGRGYVPVPPERQKRYTLCEVPVAPEAPTVDALARALAWCPDCAAAWAAHRLTHEDDLSATLERYISEEVKKYVGRPIQPQTVAEVKRTIESSLATLGVQGSASVSVDPGGQLDVRLSLAPFNPTQHVLELQCEVLSADIADDLKK